ncbi:hypothetical protein ACHWQZ_G002833 [Mnemiopsis leidyi]
METNNMTIYGIQQRGHQLFWMSGYLITIILSVLGNIIILLATVKYKAIKLDKVTVTLILNIALSDLGHTMTTVVPRTAGVYDPEWVIGLGRVVGEIRVCFGYYFYQSSMFLVMTLNLSKVTRLLMPLRVTRSRSGRMIAGIVWVGSALWPALFLLVDPRDTYFDYRVYVANYGFRSPVWVYLLPVVVVMLGVLPNLVVVVTTIVLLVLARRISRRHKDRLQRLGIVTVILIAIVYCISNFPLSVYLIGQCSGAAQTDEEGREVGTWYIEFYRFAWNVIPLNNLANVVIYTCSINSFREFVRDKLWLGCRRRNAGSDRNMNMVVVQRSTEISKDL